MINVKGIKREESVKNFAEVSFDWLMDSGMEEVKII
jgi:hypothetical protein